jgi:hypothetical protein
MRESSVDQEKLEKVRKLLAMAEGGKTAAEAEAFAAKANELMIKWGIADAQLAADKKITSTIEYKFYPPTGPSTYAHEFVILGIGIADALGAQGIISQGHGVNARGTGMKKTESLGIIGFTEDVERILLLWRSLEIQCMNASKQAVDSLGKWAWQSMTGMEKYNFRRSFIVGFSGTVKKRLRDLYTEVVAAETARVAGTDLVLVDRKAQITKWSADHLNLRDTASRQYGYNGMGMGSAAGSKANIGQTGLGASTQRAIGN